MSEKLTATPELREKLANANGDPIPLCDEAGNIVGYALTPARMAKAEQEHAAVVAWLDGLWPPEEIVRIKERLGDDTRRKHTMAEVLRLVEGHDVHRLAQLLPADDPPGTAGDPQSDDPEAVARWIAEFDAIPPLQMTPAEEADWRSARETKKP